jgi:cobalt-zinc-cadmium resistance protein CzcA
LQADPEVAAVLSRIGRPEDGTDPAGSHEVQLLVRLRGSKSASARAAWMAGMRAELRKIFPSTIWEVTTQERDPLQEVFTGKPGAYQLKLFGPDLADLDRLELQVRNALGLIAGVETHLTDVLKGTPELTVRVDREKCTRLGVSVAAVQRVLTLARQGQAVAIVNEGDRSVPLVLCWPEAWHEEQDTGEAILALPVEGAGRDTWHPLRDLVASTEKRVPGGPEEGFLVGPRTVAIYREQGRRMMEVNVKLPEGNTAALIEARAKVRSLVQEPYLAEWIRR